MKASHCLSNQTSQYTDCAHQLHSASALEVLQLFGLLEATLVHNIDLSQQSWHILLGIASKSFCKYVFV